MTRNKESENRKEDQNKNAIGITDATHWDAIRSGLFSNRGFRDIPDNESESIDVLIDTLANSSSCYLRDGDVVARFDELFELVFRIRETLAYRYQKYGIFRAHSGLPATRKIRIDMRPAHDKLSHLGSRIRCIWSSGGRPDDSVMIDCAGFVIWADSGFDGFSSNLSASLLEYRMRSYFEDIVEQVGLWSLSLSWQDAFDAYELKGNPAEEDDDCEFRRLARKAILGWMLFPESKPFTGEMGDVGSEAIARMIFKEFDEDRRYQ